MPVPPDILHRWGIAAVADLGGSFNHHWVVDRRGHRYILRMVPAEAFADLGYEVRLLDALHARGWPVARVIEEPVTRDDGTTWCLFEHLEGERVASHGDAADQRARGRLLAALHADLADLDAGQRGGWTEVADVVRDPGLHEQLRRLEAHLPDEARILRRHAERATQLFDDIGPDAAKAPRLVVHGDFVPWNLLYREGALSGVLDFEHAHLDLAVADFANAWRGRYDDVVAGYEEVRPLTEIESRLLTPTFWAWQFVGLADHLRAAGAEPRAPEWCLGMLLRRSPRMGRDATPYAPCR